MQRIRKGDEVTVLAGRDRGKKGSVLRVLLDEDRVVVQGVNMVKRHTRQNMRQQGGIVEKETPIHISNVALADPKSGKPTRVGFKFMNDGRKVRFAKASGEVID